MSERIRTATEFAKFQFPATDTVGFILTEAIEYDDNLLDIERLTMGYHEMQLRKIQTVSLMTVMEQYENDEHLYDLKAGYVLTCEDMSRYYFGIRFETTDELEFEAIEWESNMEADIFIHSEGFQEIEEMEQENAIEANGELSYLLEKLAILAHYIDESSLGYEKYLTENVLLTHGQQNAM